MLVYKFDTSLSVDSDWKQVDNETPVVESRKCMIKPIERKLGTKVVIHNFTVKQDVNMRKDEKTRMQEKFWTELDLKSRCLKTNASSSFH